MTHWIRYSKEGDVGFGALEGDKIVVHAGDMFEECSASGDSVDLASVDVLTPTVPSKMICLWNNFHALAAKLDVMEPDEPLYLLKATTAFLPHGGIIRRPATYDGKVIYEGELGIVIGRTCANISETDAADHILGYTCINDVTAIELLKKNPTFDQWTRAKSFDTFGVYGPVVATDLATAGVNVRTILNGDERQNYPVSDMIFPPPKLVSMLSRDMTLLPGDVIACGTSLGVGSMKEPENTIDICIEGIGRLSNIFVNSVRTTG